MYNKKNILHVFSFLFMALPTHAKDLGSYGETFSIQEENLLSVIQRKLQTLEQNGGTFKHQQELARKATHKIQNPPAAQGIKPTTTPRTWLYDPSLKVQDDIKDHQGKIIVAKGTVVNPLDTVSWGVPLLFLDGDDPAQVAWAQGQDANAKWVLVKGKPLELEEQLGRSIYFDQGSMLVRKFGITQVPCRITQQDKQLLVQELMSKGIKS
ncbi:MAG: type-F conjugative transfer system protein TraW [Janthinobacterium lividum]